MNVLYCVKNCHSGKLNHSMNKYLAYENAIPIKINNDTTSTDTRPQQGTSCTLLSFNSLFFILFIHFEFTFTPNNYCQWKKLFASKNMCLWHIIVPLSCSCMSCYRKRCLIILNLEKFSKRWTCNWRAEKVFNRKTNQTQKSYSSTERIIREEKRMKKLIKNLVKEFIQRCVGDVIVILSVSGWTELTFTLNEMSSAGILLEDRIIQTNYTAVRAPENHQDQK